MNGGKTGHVRLIGLSVVLALAVLNACQSQDEERNFYSGPEVDRVIEQRAIRDKEELTGRKLAEYGSLMAEGPVIPGLFNAAVPQGLAYIPQQKLLAISSYMSDRQASVLIFVSLEDGGLHKALSLENVDGSAHRGHVGGLAVVGDRLWIASGKEFYSVPLVKVEEAKDGGKLTLPPAAYSEVNCDTAASHGETLLIGEFWSDDERYPTADSHKISTPGGSRYSALMAGFSLEESPTGWVEPDFLLSIPDKVQGAVFFDDKIILSRSYGRRNLSELSIYRSPMSSEEPDVFVLRNGTSSPLWYLEEEYLMKKIAAPPMSEGISLVGDRIAVLYESGADTYRYSARFPQDRIHFLDLNRLIDSP
ncbi:MAG TPA: hypothetical protein ENN41_01605 [Sediminispirochaeta sp.]|nr:hypothetical protein [Sediminispirochaeta sp.]